LKADLSLGSGPVLIRGDLYEMRSPWLLGGARIVCSAGELDPVPMDGTFPALPVVNVLDFIVGLTKHRSGELTRTELQTLQQEFSERQGLFSAIRALQNDEAFDAGLGDLKSAVDFLRQEKPRLGGARWACLQAVEKFLKAWITKRGGSFPNTHSLADLNDRASRLGLPRVSDTDLALVQCPAGVRYGEITVSIEEVTDAFNAALRCCALVAKEVGRSQQDHNLDVRTPNPNALTREQFLSLKEGDLLDTSGLQLTVTGVAQESPRWYRTLVVGATKETMIMEDDFQSFTLVKRGSIWSRSPRTV
jgi:hypothetical protein